MHTRISRSKKLTINARFMCWTSNAAAILSVVVPSVRYVAACALGVREWCFALARTFCVGG